jgi:hypothetical protein
LRNCAMDHGMKKYSVFPEVAQLRNPCGLTDYVDVICAYQ